MNGLRVSCRCCLSVCLSVCLLFFFFRTSSADWNAYMRLQRKGELCSDIIFRSTQTILRCAALCSTANFSIRFSAISSPVAFFVIAFTLPKPPLPIQHEQQSSHAAHEQPLASQISVSPLPSSRSQLTDDLPDKRAQATAQRAVSDTPRTVSAARTVPVYSYMRSKCDRSTQSGLIASLEEQPPIAHRCASPKGKSTSGNH